MSKKKCNNEGKDEILRNMEFFFELLVEKVFHRCGKSN